MRDSRTLVAGAVVTLVLGAAYLFYTGRERAGDATISLNSKNSMTSTLTLTSTAFENNGLIPAAFTCDEDRTISPALSISGVPEGAKSLALIMDDPDVPRALKPAGVYDHWVLFNIPPTARGILQGGTAGTAGANGAGQNAYTGPCPPPQYEPSEHRYFFKLYALNTLLSLAGGATKAAVEKAMEGHILDKTELVGRYKRR
jgi:hypothetical protein